MKAANLDDPSWTGWTHGWNWEMTEVSSEKQQYTNLILEVVVSRVFNLWLKP
jgi:hypothetical protein